MLIEIKQNKKIKFLIVISKVLIELLHGSVKTIITGYFMVIIILEKSTSRFYIILELFN